MGPQGMCQWNGRPRGQAPFGVNKIGTYHWNGMMEPPALKTVMAFTSAAQCMPMSPPGQCQCISPCGGGW